MFGSTSSPEFGHSLVDLLRLRVCESHVEQRVQGQLCGCRLHRERTGFMVVLLRRALAAGGAEQSAAGAHRLEVASARLKWTEYRGGGTSHSPPKNLKENRL